MTTDVTDISRAIEEAAVVASQADEQSIALLASAESFTITTDIQYGQSAELLKAIKAREKELNSLRLSVTRPIDEAKARVMQLFRPASDKLAKAETAIKNAMLTFTREQQRKRAEQQHKLEEQARAELEKLERRAEAERERLRALAKEQREKGQEKRAEASEERAAQVEAPIVTAAEVAPSTPKVAGIVTRTVWRAEVADLLALVKAVAEGVAPLSFLQPNMQGLNAAARAEKNELAIPGVVVVSDEEIAARAS